MKRLLTTFTLSTALLAGWAENYMIQVDNPRQTILHFGASDAWSMQSIGTWPEEQEQAKIADWLFSMETDAQGQPRGIGLSLWRFNLGAGSSEQGRDAQINRDTRTECFLQADGTYEWTKQAGQRKFLRMAKERGVPYFLAFLNSPPVYFTQNGYPSSSIIPWINFNIDKRVGFDFSVYANKKFGDFDLTLGVSGMWYKSTADKRDENVEFDYLSAVGKALNGLWGLESDGLYQSQAEIDAGVRQTFGDVKPGDIRYKDQNGDGKIDDNDRVFLGRWDSPFMSGINFTLKWKNLTFFALGNLYMGGHGMKDNSYYWMPGTSKYSEIARECWTPENTAAAYPRLTTTNGVNNYRASDFWMYKNQYNEVRIIPLKEKDHAK